MAPRNSAGLALAAGHQGFAGGKLNANAQRPFIDTDGDTKIIVVNEATGEIHKVKTNATALLTYDEWKDIDTSVIEAAVDRMVGIADLRSRGLVHPLGSIGVTISLYQTMSDMTEANVSMSAVTRGEKDSPAYGNALVPVPIVHKEFGFELRRLEASRRMGEGLDLTGPRMAGRLVAERSERMLFSGANIAIDGNTIYGYLTHPNRNTVNLTENWDAVGKTGAEIVADVVAMLQAARTDKHYGPYMLYIPSAYETAIDADYRDNDDRTIRERILAHRAIVDIQVADFLPANNVVLVQLSQDVVDLAIAQDITTVQWQLMGGMQEEFKTMAVWVPRVKSDFDGRSGIVHLRANP